MGHLLERSAAGLFLDPGLGKTSITLGALSVLKKQGIPHRALIVAPMRVMYNVWPNEIKKWEDFAHLSVGILHGKTRADVYKLPFDVTVVNPEGIPWLSANWKLWKHKPDILVVDESTKFKSWNAVRFKTLKGLLKYFRRRWILTGTPTPNSLIDLFAQVYIMDEGAALGEYITKFRSTYFRQTGYQGYEYKPEEGAEEKIYEKIAPYILRLSAKDHIDMPDKMEQEIYVTLPPKARAIYKKIEDELFAEIADGYSATVGHAAAAGLKCQQVANGGLYVDMPESEDGSMPVKQARPWVDIHNEKVDALADLVEELQGSPLLVGYSFITDVEKIRDKLGTHIPFIGGGVKQAELDDIIPRWNRGEIPVLLGHPASMAHGLNLQGACNHVAWFSMTWNLEHYDQFVGRVWRQGSKFGHVVVHHFIAEKTVDEAILFALKRKGKTQTSVLEALAKYRNF